MTNQTDHFGWWLASDGKWYPPELHPAAPWVDPGDSADHRPVGSAEEDGSRPAPGWWVASDGMWYPPELHPMVAGAGDDRGAETADATRAGFVGDTDHMETPVIPSSSASGTVAEGELGALDAGLERTAAVLELDLDVAGTLAEFAHDGAVPVAEVDTVAEVEMEVSGGMHAPYWPEATDEAAGVVEDSVVEDSVVEDSVVEDGVVEDGVVEDGVVEDSVVEDGVVDEPVAANAFEGEPNMDGPAAEGAAPRPGWTPAPFSSSDWLPGGPFGVDPTAEGPEVSGRPGRRRRRKH